MSLKYFKNVTTLSLSAEKCTGCGKCAEVCPHGVFDMNERKALIAKKDLCMECGACALNCPTEAIKVNAGVGCAAAISKSLLTGGEPSCGCGDGGCC
ncbi:MAG: ferredoxin family protein [Leptospirales bacterium]|nr:ferredoxin family protein [Leptospirales bacterium]